jgi:hydrogenase-4 membrane subunit HyfE
MSAPFVAFLVVLLLPLFIGTWRTSLMGLAAQGLLLFWLALERVEGLSWETAVTLVDVGLVRALLVPVLFFRLLTRQNAPPRNDMIPPNLLFWAMAGGLVGLAFDLAGRLVPAPGDERAQLAVAGSGVLLGLFVLATRTSPFSQMIGALRLENAIALFELASPVHLAPLPVQLGITAVFVLTVIAFAVYLHRLHLTTLATSASESASL